MLVPSTLHTVSYRFLNKIKKEHRKSKSFFEEVNPFVFLKDIYLTFHKLREAINVSAGILVVIGSQAIWDLKVTKAPVTTFNDALRGTFFSRGKY